MNPAPTDGQILSAQLRALELRIQGRPTRLARIFAVTQGRGIYLLMILCCLPFLTPVPTPMLSTAFGLVILFTALRLALGHPPWLPRCLLMKRLPAGFISRVLRAAARLLGWLEARLRPRLRFMHGNPRVERMSAVVMALAALLLMLPVPVPFSNFFPAAAILLLSAGALARDGACSLAGWLMCALAAGFFSFLALGGATIMDHFAGRV